MKISSNNKSLILSFCCMLLWSLIPVFSKSIMDEIDSYQYLMYSNFISVFFLSCLAGDRKILKEYFYFFKNKKFLLFSFIIGLLDCLYYLILYFTYANESAYVITITQYTWPIIISILSLLVFKEKPGWKTIISLFIGFFALFYVVTNGEIFSFSISNMKAVYLTLIAALSFSILSVLSKVFKLPPVSATFYLFIFSFILSFLANIYFSNLTTLSIKSVLIIIVNGGVINGLSYIIWIKALQLGSAVKASIIIMFTPLLSMTWIAMLFQEQLHYYHLIGLLLIIVSGILVITDNNKSSLH